MGQLNFQISGKYALDSSSRDDIHTVFVGKSRIGQLLFSPAYLLSGADFRQFTPDDDLTYWLASETGRPHQAWAHNLASLTAWLFIIESVVRRRAHAEELN